MSIQHVQMSTLHNNSKTVMYPITSDSSVMIDEDIVPSGLSNIRNLNDLISQLGSLAFEDYVALNVGTDVNYGLVKITNSITNSQDQDVVPTVGAVYTAINNLKTANEDITGVKNFVNGIQISGVPITYDSNTQTLSIGSST